MSKIVIRIRDLKVGKPEAYPVELLLDDGRSLDWQERPVATGRMPVDLALPGTRAGEGLTAEKVRGVLLGTEETSDDLEAAGGFLFELLSTALGEEGLAVWRREWRTGTALDVEPRSLRRLPWELLREDLGAFFLDAQAPVARWTRIPQAPAVSLEPLTWPLRVLVIWAWDPHDRTIQGEREVEAIRDATCRLRHWYDVELLRQPTKAELRERYDAFRPQIFHFIGHGASGPQGGLLELWNGGGSQDWRVAEIYQFLRTAPPRLAFLNACRTSSSGQAGAEEGSWDVASALLKAGTAAVLGMQGDIQGDSAAVFAKCFYAELVKGTPVDRAVAESRMKLMAESSLRHRDWALPCLELAVPPEQVFPMEAPAGKSLELLDAAAFREINAFVDRSQERRKLREGLERRNGRPAPDVLLISGERQIGKTWVIKCCLQGCAARGHRLVYVDLARTAAPPYSVVDVLRLIRGPREPGSELLRPHLYPYFWRFNEELNHLLCGKEPPEPAAVQREVVDEMAPFEANQAHPKLLRRIFQSFLPALRSAAGDQPLVVALDHLSDGEGGVMQDDLRRYLFPSLILPVANHQYEPVRLILALRELVFDPGLPQGLVLSLPLEEIPVCDFEPLAREYLFLNKLDRDEASNIIAALRGWIERGGRSTWSPSKLWFLAGLIGSDARKA